MALLHAPFSLKQAGKLVMPPTDQSSSDPSRTARRHTVWVTFSNL